MLTIQRRPDAVHVETDDGWHQASHEGQRFEVRGVQVSVVERDRSEMHVLLESSTEPVLRIHLRWKGLIRNVSVLGDHWERGYGDLGWQTMVPERVMPWYMMVFDGTTTCGYGVKTGASALCYWRIDSGGISLVLDVRSGNRGIRLGERTLHAATILTLRDEESRSTYRATERFCRLMCPHPVLPSEPVYGGNNWYYAYGNSSAQEIMEDTKRIAAWAPAGDNRPFMVIDDGWQMCSGGGACNGGPWIGNYKFPDMGRLADDMVGEGVRPGIWMRPLLVTQAVPSQWVRARVNGAVVLDPSVPDVLQYVGDEVRKLSGWGYELIKHDFTTFDIMGNWGFEMGADVPMAHGFYDPSRTTAEIISSLYRVIAEASGDSLIIGCNTIGHLGAGLFEIQRTGDDTSGREWERTRKMGINTLAFRMPQHGTFFSADADCVGLTESIPWALNAQWLQLLAESGTPLFISADPKAVGPAQERAIRQAFERASTPIPAAEPLDWMDTTCPTRWRFDDREVTFDWFGAHGLVPCTEDEKQ